MKVIGYITRRRSCGKNLAFADIQVEESEDDWLGSSEHKTNNDKHVVKIKFQRDSSVWKNEFDDTFPSTASKLPYGGKVCVDLFEPAAEPEGNQNFQVHTWELLVNPKEEALAAAKQDGADGISCTLYLKSRGNAYFRFNEKAPPIRDDKKDGKSKQDTTNTAKSTPSSSLQNEEPNNESSSSAATKTATGDFSHGDNRAKALRATIFASWLIETYGEDNLRGGNGVLDIAGGKDKLLIELAIQGKIPSTIVDPLVRKHRKKLDPTEAKRIRKADAPHPNLVAKPFNQTTFLEEESGGEELLVNASICVGLHPDECIKDILDLALKYNKPVAIVPCCVFWGFFPLRTLRCGTAVRTCEQFLEYLLAKDERLQLETLPFEGRNKVIYYCLKN